ncbi:MAG: hypothetical protein NC341_06270 [Blautia sp.]|nr:hypothetical protein [Blautia sp.]MCM1201029.1 hypothetical protein [Bacteroides fragilis]
MDFLARFLNMIDPSTVLGAFLISVCASLFVGFFSRKKEKGGKENRITVKEAKNIDQDVGEETKHYFHKKNTIRADKVTGNIRQDVRK